MHDGNLDILDYLPGEYSSVNEAEYIEYWKNVMLENTESGKYHIAFFAHHILFMVAIEYLILRLSRYFPKEYTASIIHYTKPEEKVALVLPTSPFSFSIVNERALFRFFKLAEIDEALIKKAQKMVDRRNDASHANGQIFFDHDLAGLEEMIVGHNNVLSELIVHFTPQTTRIIQAYFDGIDDEDRESTINELRRREHITQIELRAIAGIEPE